MRPLSKYTCTCRPSPVPPTIESALQRQTALSGQQTGRQRACWEEFSSELWEQAGVTSSLSLPPRISRFSPHQTCTENQPGGLLQQLDCSFLIYLHVDPPRVDTHWRPFLFQRCWILLIWHCSPTNEQQTWANPQEERGLTQSKRRQLAQPPWSSSRASCP